MSAHPRISVPSFDSVWPKIRNSAQKIADDTAWLTSWNRKSIGLMIPAVIGLALFLLALLMFFTGHPLLAMATLVIAVVVAGPPVLYIMRHARSASDKHAETVVAPMIEELMEHMSAHTISDSEARLKATYTPDGGMPVSVLSRSGFIRDSKALQEDFIRGTFGETDFMITDVKWQTSKVELSAEAQARIDRRKKFEQRQRERERDRRLRRKHGKDWRRHKYLEDLRRNRSSGSSLLDLVPEEWVNKAKEKYEELEETTQKMGPSMIVFAADFHKDFASKTYLLPRKTEEQAFRDFSKESAAAGGMEPMVLEDPGINKRFKGWTSDQLEARYLLTPELMLAISDAADRMESERIAVSFRGSWMYFAVVLDEDRFSLQLTGDDDGGYAVAKAIYDDLVAFLSLIEHFNLNTRIWSKV